MGKVPFGPGLPHDFNILNSRTGADKTCQLADGGGGGAVWVLPLDKEEPTLCWAHGYNFGPGIYCAPFVQTVYALVNSLVILVPMDGVKKIQQKCKFVITQRISILT